MTQRSDHETDAACEKAYRRGYAYGVQTMMSAIVDKLSKAERQSFEVWFCRRSDTVVTGHRQLSPTRTATLVTAHGQRNLVRATPWSPSRKYESEIDQRASARSRSNLPRRRKQM